MRKRPHSQMRIKLPALLLALLLALPAGVLAAAAPLTIPDDIPDEDLLTIREGCELDAQGRWTGVTAETVLLDSRHLATVDVDLLANSLGEESPVIRILFSPEGAELFAEATGRLVGEQMSIWAGEDLLSAPYVSEPILNGEAVITGGFTEAEAQAIAERITGRRGASIDDLGAAERPSDSRTTSLGWGFPYWVYAMGGGVLVLVYCSAVL